MPPRNNDLFNLLNSGELSRLLYPQGPGGEQNPGMARNPFLSGIPAPSLGGDELDSASDLGPGGGLVQTGEDITTAPIIEMLMEMRARRESNSSRAQNAITSLLAAAPKLAPAGAKYFPGYEHGGIADIMMGFLSGKGPAHGALPEEIRAPGKVPVDMSLIDRIAAPEPGVESDFPMASDLAMKILQAAMRTPRFAQSSSSGGGNDLQQAMDYITNSIGGQ